MDIDHTHQQHPGLRFVLSPSSMPASVVYTSTHQAKREGAWLEVCPQGLVLAQEIAERVVRMGGAALIADYGCGGDAGGTRNTLRVRNNRNHPFILIIRLGCLSGLQQAQAVPCPRESWRS